MKRFYKEAGVSGTDDGFTVELDGRQVKTPAKNDLVLPSEAVAAAVAAEWEAQGEDIDPHTMRITRLANSAIDRVVEHRETVVREIAGYAGADLVCYRAAKPQTLAARQREGWDPLIAWLEDHLGVELRTTTGLLPVDQDARSLAKIRTVVDEFDPFALSGLHSVTSCCGSIVIGLAVHEGRIDGSDAWELSLIDETHQIDKWGEDPEATRRRQGLLDEIIAASAFLRLLRGDN